MKNLKCNIFIENLPSRAEFYALLERFVKDNGIPEDYKLTNRTVGVEIHFNNPDHAYNFLKFLNFFKRDNPIYTKMKAILNLDAKTRFLTPEINKNKQDTQRIIKTRNDNTLKANVFNLIL